MADVLDPHERNGDGSLRAEPYACPQTREALTRVGDVLRNAGGDRVYAIRGEVPHFLRYEPAETPETLDELARLNELARRDGWRQALETVYGAHRYVTDDSRLAALDLLDLSPGSVVLEVGASLGQFSVEIAKRAGALFALEVVSGQAAFALERCRQEGCSNVRMACGGDDCRLPYQDASFDAVMISLVLEWCFGRDDAGGAAETQRRLIAEAYRVLRPGGQLYLSTKNRYALRYLIGKQDEHAAGMRFGSALPRWLTAMLLRRRGKTRPDGLLHSHSALRRMLLDAGFSDAPSYWAAPDVRYPKHHISTDAAAIRAARRDEPALVQGEFRITRLLMPWIPAPLVKYVTPGLLFVARKA